MLKNYLKIAYRDLKQNKGYAFINVTGLAVGMACCLLILMLVRHEMSFDAFNEHASRIHRVLIQETRPDGTLDYRNLMPPTMAAEIDSTYPAITDAVRVVKGILGVQQENQLVPEYAVMTDSAFFDVFTFPLLAGDRASALDDPQSVVLTPETARHHFGDVSCPGEARNRCDYENILGKPFTIVSGEERHPFTVTGVLAPIPANSSLQFDMLLSFAQYETIPIGGNDWGGRTSLYLMLEKGQDAGRLEEALPPFTTVQLADRIEGRREAGYLVDGPEAFKLILQPLPELHVSPAMDVDYEQATHDPRHSYVLLGIALLVLLIACINFITLSIGRSARRAREVGMRKALGAVTRRTKEIGVRKVLGATISDITVLVTKEFALLVGVAMLLAWPFAYLWMGSWLERFAYRISIPWWVFAAAGGAALVLAIGTVSYHALRAATADPVTSLRTE